MGKLFIVPTPIGNLEDITLRAIRILKEAALVLAEDTRTSSKLLNHYGIKSKMMAYHQFNEHKSIQNIIQKIEDSEATALISDAGTPGISDAGFLLIRECINRDIEVECLPGATALIPALVASGLPCERFVFEGFLPVKKGRQARLKQISLSENTSVFYESPHRLLKTLDQMIEIMGNERKVVVVRELTKIHEEKIRGSLEYVRKWFGEHLIKGEIVIVLEGHQK